MSVNIGAIHLNLLRLFDAIMRERTVTGAARRIGVSQPAASNALNRLRLIVGDPLFTRSAIGMRPTTRALQLAKPIAEALQNLEAAFDPEFDPLHTEHTFRLALSDQASVTILPRLAKQLKRTAPGVSLHIQPKALPAISGLLDSTQMDAAIGYFEHVPAGYASRKLYDDRYVCMMSRNHPLARNPITLEAFAAARQLSMRSVAQPAAIIDGMLAEHGLSRKIALSVSQFVSIPELLAETGLVLALFEKTVFGLPDIAEYDLVYRLLPVQSIEMKLVWHNSTDDHAAHRWIRSEICSVADELGHPAAKRNGPMDEPAKHEGCNINSALRS